MTFDNKMSMHLEELNDLLTKEGTQEELFKLIDDDVERGSITEEGKKLIVILLKTSLRLSFTFQRNPKDTEKLINYLS